MSKVLDIVMQRRSERHFSQRALEPEVVDALIEGFRWAPSSNNRQPWRLILARGEAASAAFDASLSDANKLWAPATPLKMVLVGNPEEQPDRDGLQCFMLDCGLALQNLLLQGYSMGLTIHAMAGWNADLVKTGFGIRAPLVPVALVAAGYRGSIDALSPELQAKDRRPRVRKAVELARIFTHQRLRAFVMAEILAAQRRYRHQPIPAQPDNRGEKAELLHAGDARGEHFAHPAR